MNKSITDTLSLLEQATDILMQAIRKSTDMKDCQDMIFSNIQIIKTIKAINDRCGKTAPGNNQKSKKTEILRTIEYTIHAEGVSLKNCAGPGGYAVIIRRNDGYTEKGAKGFKDTTYNRMGLQAILTAMKTIDSDCENTSSIGDIRITISNRHIFDAFNEKWIDKWEKKKFANVSNCDIWAQLVPMIRRHKVTFTFIKKPYDNPINRQCHLMAQKAASNPIY